MPTLVLESLQSLKDYVGREISTTGWLPVTQERIRQFAEATGDRQWIHVDPERARRESPYGAAIAHGFLTLKDETEVLYQMSEFYHPELARGVRWDDPAFQIVWPGEVAVISERDRTYPNFEQVQCAS